MEENPRHITPTSTPYEPIDLARKTEQIVCRTGPKGLERRYTAFYATGVYGGIATGYTVGCCLRCIFCWVDLSREFPEKYGDFYSPEKAFNELKKTAHRFGVSKLRISGAEPTLGKEHLLALLDYVENSEFPLFILETNGILLGLDKDYVKNLASLTKVHVRVSLKAGTPQEFTKRTGAIPERFDLPYKAIRNLLDSGISFHVASMSDPRLMPKEERQQMIVRLKDIDARIARNLEEELCDPYETTLIRLTQAGIDTKEFFREKR